MRTEVMMLTKLNQPRDKSHRRGVHVDQVG